MVEISNVGPLGDNGSNGPKKPVRQNSSEKSTSTFDEYRKFQQEKLNEYKEFQQKTLEEFESFRNEKLQEFENFRNEAMERFDSFRQSVIGGEKDNTKAAAEEKLLNNTPDAMEDALASEWKEYKAQPGISFYSKPKPKTAPVYNPEASPVKDIDADTAAGGADRTNLVSAKDNPSVETPQQEKSKIPFSVVERDGVIGKYKITTGSDGTGFSLATNMSVSRGGEAMDFFRLNGDAGNEMKYDKDSKRYSFRGIQSHDQSFLQSRMTMASQSVSINNAIYNDLLNKQKNGTELTDAEQSFIKYHFENLERYGLGVDENGNLINKSE